MNEDRLSQIRQHLYSHGLVTIQELSALTGASLPTIRRDLQRLEEDGVIERVHGGAKIVSDFTTELAFELREKKQLVAKRAIANAAYELLVPNSTIFMDAGTTVLQLARKIRLSPLPLTVFTNSLAISQELISVPDVSVLLLGGKLRPENLSVVGPLAELMLDRLWFDQVFMGLSAVGAEGTMFSIDLHEATLNARTLARATKKIVLADASKFGTLATYAVAHLQDMDRIITDAKLSQDWLSRLSNMDVHLTVANPDQEAESIE